MRIALISAVKLTPKGELRAELELAGRSVLAWQVDFALDSGCERVICLCDRNSVVTLEEQRRVENLGLSFHAARNLLQFRNLVRSDDHIFAQLDGLVLGGSALNDVKKANDAAEIGLYTLAANHVLSESHPADFERLDRERHWAGILGIPGGCLEALDEMPDDVDTMSLLLRLGLQARIPCKTVSSALLDDDQWLLVSDEQAMERRSDAVIAASVVRTSWSGPGTFAAAAVVRSSAKHWLGSGSEICAGLALTTMVMASVLSAIDCSLAGLGAATVATFVASLSVNARNLRQGISAHYKVSPALRTLAPLMSLLSVVVLILAYPRAADFAVQIAVPVLAIGLAHLAGQANNQRRGAFWQDLPIHFLLFAVSDFFEVLQEALLLFSIGALLHLLLHRPAD
ncbi:MAG: hypothetical protein AAGI28_08095 [Pseudomonadota bacterium]